MDLCVMDLLELLLPIAAALGGVFIGDWLGFKRSSRLHAMQLGQQRQIALTLLAEELRSNAVIAQNGRFETGLGFIPMLDYAHRSSHYWTFAMPRHVSDSCRLAYAALHRYNEVIRLTQRDDVTEADYDEMKEYCEIAGAAQLEAAEILYNYMREELGIQPRKPDVD